jgi:hypothetical protein
MIRCASVLLSVVSDQCLLFENTVQPWFAASGWVCFMLIGIYIIAHVSMIEGRDL